MSHTPNYDAKIKTILDSLQPGERVCSVTGKPWQLTQEEIDICRKFNVPPSTIEPDIRFRMMHGFNTGLAIFWKQDAKTGKPIIAAIHPDSPIQAVHDADWMNEDWSVYNQPIDQTRSVWDQLWNLISIVPLIASRSVDMQNSVGVGSVHTLDSFMTCASSGMTRSFYTYAVFSGEDSVDIANTFHVTRSYQVAGSVKIVDCQYIYESQSCLSSSFLFDCWNCEFCFGATNKRNKSYLWFNEQLSKEEWEQRRAEVDLSIFSVAEAYKAKFFELWKREGVWPQTFGMGNAESTGERIMGCVRCTDCYWQNKSIDCFSCRFGVENNQCAYSSGIAWESNTYSSTGCQNGIGNRFCVSNLRCTNMELSFNCLDCQNCFGCVSLQKRQFCIFNKQYTEEEYWKQVDELKCIMLDRGEYGNFFPAKFSPSGFQYSVGELYMGYAKEELEQYGALVFDPARGQVLAPQPSVPLIPLDPTTIPDRLEDMDPSLFLNKPFRDASIGRNYSVIPSEFQAYKEHHWPFPRRHFVARLTDLVRSSNSPIKEETTCGNCRASIVTYKNLSFPERNVYCQPCYLQYLEKNG